MKKQVITAARESGNGECALGKSRNYGMCLSSSLMESDKHVPLICVEYQGGDR